MFEILKLLFDFVKLIGVEIAGAVAGGCLSVIFVTLFLLLLLS